MATTHSLLLVPGGDAAPIRMPIPAQFVVTDLRSSAGALYSDTTIMMLDPAGWRALARAATEAAEALDPTPVITEPVDLVGACAALAERPGYDAAWTRAAREGGL